MKYDTHKIWQFVNVTRKFSQTNNGNYSTWKCHPDLHYRIFEVSHISSLHLHFIYLLKKRDHNRSMWRGSSVLNLGYVFHWGYFFFKWCSKWSQLSQKNPQWVQRYTLRICKNLIFVGRQIKQHIDDTFYFIFFTTDIFKL